MFELMFGIIWMAITGISTVVILQTGALTDGLAPFLSMSVFMLIFWGVGIYMLKRGLKKVIANAKTNAHGIETFGVILTIDETGCYVNDRPQLQAEVLVVTEGKELNRYTEVIGFDWNKYHEGQLLKVKHYQNDINVIGAAVEAEIPYDILVMLTNSQPNTAKDGNIPVQDWRDYIWNEEEAFRPEQKTADMYEEQPKEEDVETFIMNGVKYTRKKKKENKY